MTLSMEELAKPLCCEPNVLIQSQGKYYRRELQDLHDELRPGVEVPAAYLERLCQGSLWKVNVARVEDMNIYN